MAEGTAQRAPLPGPRQQWSPGQSQSVWLLHVLDYDHPAAGLGCLPVSERERVFMTAKSEFLFILK